LRTRAKCLNLSTLLDSAQEKQKELTTNYVAMAASKRDGKETNLGEQILLLKSADKRSLMLLLRSQRAPKMAINSL